MIRAVVFAGVAFTLLATAFGGKEVLARLALSLGLPETAAAVSQDAGIRGISAYRLGEFAAAATAFETAGDRFNAGLAHTRAGNYAAALVVWEQALAADPGDREARANHRLVTALISGTELDVAARPAQRDRDGPTAEAPEGQGKGRAIGQGDSATNAKTGFWMPEVTSEGLRRVPHIFDAQYMAADPLWLDTLEDQPGLYLRARLAAEQKQRETSGRALPQAEDPR
ncbi:MAG: hypothetical protein AAF409_13760 [Pseudomonadota bacterium]